MKAVCILAVGAGLMFSGVTYAQSQVEPSENQLRLARELVGLFNYEGNFRTYLQQCQKSADSYFDPEIAFKADPQSFGGLSPKLSHWAEVEAIYSTYRHNVCSYLTATQVTDFYARSFAAQLSEKDLEVIIAFQKSPTGRKLQTASDIANEQYITMAQQALVSLYEKAYKDASVEIAEVVQKWAGEADKP